MLAKVYQIGIHDMGEFQAKLQHLFDFWKFSSF